MLSLLLDKKPFTKNVTAEFTSRIPQFPERL
jgi:hypothetical protein